MRFEYGATLLYGNTTPAQVLIAGNSTVGETANLSGLATNATYNYRIVATSSGGTSYGANVSFQATNGGSALRDHWRIGRPITTSARINGTVRARNTTTLVSCDLGIDGLNFPNSINATPASLIGDLETTVTADLTNLQGGMTYYYRIRALSSNGISTRTVLSFPAIGTTSDRGAIKVTILLAAARNAGAGWRLKPEDSYRASDSQKSGLSTGTYTLQLLAVAEYAAGTNPNNSADRFRVVSSSLAGGSFRLTVPGKTGRSYRLESSDSLSGGTWATVSTSGPQPTNGDLEPTDPAPTGPKRFYRAMVTAP